MIRVTDQRRWNRTKAWACGILFLIALACIGGLEGDGSEPLPSVPGAVIAFSLAIWILSTFRSPRR